MDAIEVSYPISIGIEKGDGIDLIDDCFLPPYFVDKRIGRHWNIMQQVRVGIQDNGYDLIVAEVVTIFPKNVTLTNGLFLYYIHVCTHTLVKISRVNDGCNEEIGRGARERSNARRLSPTTRIE